MPEETDMRKIATQVVILVLAAAMTLGYTAICIAPFVTSQSKETVNPLPEADPENNSDGSTDLNDGNSPSLPEQPTDPPLPPEEDTETEPVIIPEPKATYIRSKTNGLNLRSGPGTGYPSVGYIDKDDMVTFLAKEGNWYKTLYKNKTAYISASSNYTELFEMDPHADDTVEKIIDEGLRLLGFPYVYGAIRLHDGSGRKISGFDATKYDCSSLMQYIFYYGADVNLNMTTRTQVKQGNFVAKSAIARGDLIFFTNAQRYNKTGTERIGHVALYLGENYILHTASDYAVIEQISAQRWHYYIETRRFI